MEEYKPKNALIQGDSEHKEQRENSLPIITESTAEELESVFENKETELTEKVEATLFIAGRFLNLQELIMLTDMNPVMLKEILHRLEKKYSKGALQLINRSNSWKMDVAEKYHYLINKLATGNAEFTKAEQETLAIIAYKQPIKQSVIIKIRGNKSYEHIKKFRDLGLVTSKKIGHTLDLSLSEEFYEYFNVIPRSSESIEQCHKKENSTPQDLRSTEQPENNKEGESK